MDFQLNSNWNLQKTTLGHPRADSNWFSNENSWQYYIFHLTLSGSMQAVNNRNHCTQRPRLFLLIHIERERVAWPNRSWIASPNTFTFVDECTCTISPCIISSFVTTSDKTGRMKNIAGEREREREREREKDRCCTFHYLSHCIPLALSLSLHL